MNLKRRSSETIHPIWQSRADILRQLILFGGIGAKSNGASKTTSPKLPGVVVDVSSDSERRRTAKSSGWVSLSILGGSPRRPTATFHCEVELVQVRRPLLILMITSGLTRDAGEAPHQIHREIITTPL